MTSTMQYQGDEQARWHAAGTSEAGLRLPIISPQPQQPLPINLQMLRSGYQFEPWLVQLAENRDVVPQRKRSTSERLREFHDKTLQAVAQASKPRTRAHTTHTCHEGSSDNDAAEDDSLHQQHQPEEQGEVNSTTPFHLQQHQQHQQQRQQRHQHELLASEDKAQLAEPFVHPRRMIHLSKVVHKEPAGQHAPPTLVNHSFLRSGAQFTEPRHDAALYSSFGASNADAAAGDQNELNTHRSKNRRLEEFYHKTLPPSKSNNH